jgi:hypothetical protein
MSSSTKDSSGLDHSSAMYLYAIPFFTSHIDVCGSARCGLHPSGRGWSACNSALLAVRLKINLFQL